MPALDASVPVASFERILAVRGDLLIAGNSQADACLLSKCEASASVQVLHSRPVGLLLISAVFVVSAVALLLLVAFVIIDLLFLSVLEVLEEGLLFPLRLVMLVVSATTCRGARGQEVIAGFVLVLIGAAEIR